MSRKTSTPNIYPIDIPQKPTSPTNTSQKIDNNIKCQVFVGGIPIKIAEGISIFMSNTFPDELAQYFGQFGVVKDIQLARRKNNPNSRGFAFVKFENEETAQRIFQQEHYLQGRKVTFYKP